ncbi:LysR family transcriptional regulator [cf. Phormidesmis sp. LEGE 11477]|uniref:LysR substrate-binding domain-containing protein n=1 Tax=cf. Phormidesmis sp. LEGE 11477 TaxID=1828680 RepID=UPI001882E777|nr:LysR family transcriptional regulator [cf. Phormidesmis sp. LEGE 11477]MBE9062983.1 LysR family transcriptional regulator [cf. Phormidesmis sp. LEGE 11477]
MEIKDLRCFLVLAEELNFRRAAQRLHISQPPLSRLVARLEKTLGVALFKRTTRTVELTVAGSVLVEEGKKLILQADETARRVRHATAQGSKQFRIGYVPLALYTFLPNLLSRCREQFSEVDIDLRERTTTELVSDLHSAQIDVAFLHLPVRSDLLEVKGIYRESMEIAVPTDHPLATQQSANLVDFANDTFILHSRDENPAMYDDILRCCSEAGFSPRLRRKANHQNCMALLSAGQGVHFVATGVECLQPNSISRLTLRDTVPALEVAIAWRKEDPSAFVQSMVSDALSL